MYIHQKMLKNINEVRNTVLYSNYISGLLDEEHRVMSMSEKALKAFGYSSQCDALGITSYDLPGKLSECASEYINQDKTVLQSRGKLEILDVANYSDGETRFLQTEKFFVETTCGFKGIVYHAVELHDHTLKTLLFFLLNRNKVFYGKKHVDTASFQIKNNISDHAKLTKRQFQILCLLLSGKSAKESAKILSLSPKTVESHLLALKEKYGCSSRSDLIEFSIEIGIPFCLPKEFIHCCSFVLSCLKN